MCEDFSKKKICKNPKSNLIKIKQIGLKKIKTLEEQEFMNQSRLIWKKPTLQNLDISCTFGGNSTMPESDNGVLAMLAS